MRFGIVGALVLALIGGLYVIWPRVTTYQVVGYFDSAAGIYPGDEVRVIGVPVGSVESGSFNSRLSTKTARSWGTAPPSNWNALPCRWSGTMSRPS